MMQRQHTLVVRLSSRLHATCRKQFMTDALPERLLRIAISHTPQREVRSGRKLKGRQVLIGCSSVVNLAASVLAICTPS
jgi:hypothetical protein